MWALLIAILITAGALVPPRVGYELSKRRLDAAIDRYHALAEPILPSDFRHATIPDNENAAYFLNRAATAVRWTHEQRDYLSESEIDLPLSPENATLLQELFSANTPAMKLAHEARECADTDWKLDYQSPLQNQNLHYLNDQRELANLLHVVVLYQHHIGDDFAALETVCDLDGISRSLDHQSIGVSHLTAIGVGALGTLAARQIAPHLSVIEKSTARVGFNSAGAAETHPAKPEQMHALIAELLDESTYRRGIVESWQGERMATIELMHFSGRESMAGTALMNRAALKMMPMCDQLQAAALAPNWFAACQIAPLDPANRTTEDRLVGLLLPSCFRSVREQFRSLAERRMTASIIAGRLYRADHSGSLPATLVELVPSYLPSVPADPFAADGSALSYSLEPRPRIWSVGQTVPEPRFGTERNKLLTRDQLTFPLTQETPDMPAKLTTRPVVE